MLLLVVSLVLAVQGCRGSNDWCELSLVKSNMFVWVLQKRAASQPVWDKQQVCWAAVCVQWMASVCKHFCTCACV
jgi:hypothetical protein